MASGIRPALTTNIGLIETSAAYQNPANTATRTSFYRGRKFKAIRISVQFPEGCHITIENPWDNRLTLQIKGGNPDPPRRSYNYNRYNRNPVSEDHPILTSKKKLIDVLNGESLTLDDLTVATTGTERNHSTEEEAKIALEVFLSVLQAFAATPQDIKQSLNGYRELRST